MVVDDQALVRAGFCALLDSDDELTVVGEASNGRQASSSPKRRDPTSSSWTSACRTWTASRRPAS
jgi:DNA-binding NarL/FixJ family response regulator